MGKTHRIKKNIKKIAKKMPDIAPGNILPINLLRGEKRGCYVILARRSDGSYYTYCPHERYKHLMKHLLRG